MRIEEGQIVTIEYTLRGQDGQVLESSKDRGAITFKLGSQRMLPGLAAAMEGMKVGETRKGIIPAGELVPRDAVPTRKVLFSEFPEGVEPSVGDRFQAKGPEGNPVIFEVSEGHDDGVTVLLLHPLHDTEVSYEVEVLAARKSNLPPPPPVDLPDMSDLLESSD